MKKLLLFVISLIILQSIFSIVVKAEDKMNNSAKTEINYKKSSHVRTFAIRLKAGQDPREELEKLVKIENLQAAYIITTVGSLKKAAIRFANQSNTAIIEDKLEIVSLVGTLGQDGVHLHISLSDKTGKTIGGHLQKGSQIYTTAEIVIGEMEDLQFKREPDPETTYKELSIYDRK